MSNGLPHRGKARSNGLTVKLSLRFASIHLFFHSLIRDFIFGESYEDEEEKKKQRERKKKKKKEEKKKQQPNPSECKHLHLYLQKREHSIEEKREREWEKEILALETARLSLWNC